MDESFDPSIDGPGADNPYRAEALRCHACRLKSAVESQFAEDGQTGGLYVTVRKDAAAGPGRDVPPPGPRPGRADPSLSGNGRTPAG